MSGGCSWTCRGFPFVRWSPEATRRPTALGSTKCTFLSSGILLFMRGAAGCISREFKLAKYLSAGDAVSITLDASPWGLGGVLISGDKVSSWFASDLTALDEARFHHRIGQGSGQQVWEALAILIDLKAWFPIIMGRRFSWRLSVRGDNVTALNLVLRMKAKPGPLKAIARELAMLLASSPYRPTSAYHIAGLTNVLADALSRKHDPNKSDWHLPEQLKKVERTALPARDDDYYLIAYTPRASGIQG